MFLKRREPALEAKVGLPRPRKQVAFGTNGEAGDSSERLPSRGRWTLPCGQIELMHL